jgi:hypothetical protein
MKIRIIKKNTGIQKPLTLRQEKVIAMVGNGGESKGDILRKAGYSEAVVRNPKRVFDSPAVKSAINPIVHKMREIRDKILDHLDDDTKLKKQSPYNLVIMSSILTKDSEMLDGKPTSREEYELPESEKLRLRRLLKLNS